MQWYIWYRKSFNIFIYISGANSCKTLREKHSDNGPDFLAWHNIDITLMNIIAKLMKISI